MNKRGFIDMDNGWQEPSNDLQNDFRIKSVPTGRGIRISGHDSNIRFSVMSDRGYDLGWSVYPLSPSSSVDSNGHNLCRFHPYRNTPCSRIIVRAVKSLLQTPTTVSQWIQLESETHWNLKVLATDESKRVSSLSKRVNTLTGLNNQIIVQYCRNVFK